jgi:hypothetical protein
MMARHWLLLVQACCAGRPQNECDVNESEFRAEGSIAHVE